MADLEAIAIRKKFPKYRSTKELESDRLLEKSIREQLERKKTFRQRTLTYQVMCRAMKYLNKYALAEKIPVIIKQSRLRPIVEGGWVIYEILSAPSNSSYGEHDSVSMPVILTESGLVGHASKYGNGYLLSRGCYKLSKENINLIPDKHFHYSFGYGDNWHTTAEEIVENVNKLMPGSKVKRFK